ncbi:MAG: dihydrodipicolinate synthase family protein [Desulfitobacteriaceae bacterium]
MAATANIVPSLVVEIYEKFVAGDLEGSLAAQYFLMPLRMSFSLGSWPVMTRDALNLMGFEVGDPIKPIEHMSKANMAKLREVLVILGVLS